MDKQKCCSKFNVWLFILLIAAVVVAVFSIVGKNNETKALNVANDKLIKLQQEYDETKAELQKQVEEKTQELENEKIQAKDQIDKIIKEKDLAIEELKTKHLDAISKLTQDKDKIIADLTAMNDELNKSIKEVTESSEKLMDEEELSKKIEEAVTPFVAQLESASNLKKNLQAYITGFIVKYSQDDKTPANTVVQELSKGLKTLFGE